MKKHIENVTITSETIPVIRYPDDYFVKKLRGKFDIDFTKLKFVDWQALFKDMDPGDMIHLRVTAIREGKKDEPWPLSEEGFPTCPKCDCVVYPQETRCAVCGDEVIE